MWRLKNPYSPLYNQPLVESDGVVAQSWRTTESGVGRTEWSVEGVNFSTICCARPVQQTRQRLHDFRYWRTKFLIRLMHFKQTETQSFKIHITANNTTIYCLKCFSNEVSFMRMKIEHNFSKKPKNSKRSFLKPRVMDISMFNVIQVTWIQRETMSAKRDRDLDENVPVMSGSTICPKDSRSWSLNEAHFTKDCSDDGLEL